MNDDITALKGLTLTAVERNGDDEIIFRVNDRQAFRMHHWQDCCETVEINDIAGDLDDLVGNPILTAEQRSSKPEGKDRCCEYNDSETWTFYELATIRGSVTIRWVGRSNGYYSERVDFEEFDPQAEEERKRLAEAAREERKRRNPELFRDISDTIYDISPTESPFVSVPKRPAYVWKWNAGDDEA